MRHLKKWYRWGYCAALNEPQINNTSNVRVNVTVRRVLATIVAMEKQ